MNPQTLQTRLTQQRLSSYLTATRGDLNRALRLYDWNTALSAALYEVLGMFEVVLRNALDRELGAFGSRKQWTQSWYLQHLLDTKGENDIAIARQRATRKAPAEVHGKVICELSFGFWRFLLENRYRTSIWIPAIHHAFPNHPSYPAVGFHRDVRDRVAVLHELRNRVAHLEPIHRGNVAQAHAGLLDVTSWICADSYDWIVNSSRVDLLLSVKPR